jgi:hypothetical protein
MQQALHIFKKDTRYLRLEICVTVALAAALPELWPVAAAYFIARLIHAETIPGDSQFWTTRPYRWTSLMTAKLLSILLFVNLPLAVVQLYRLIRAGFPLHSIWPGLLWSQILILLCLSFPVAALAAITPGIIAFTFLELLVVVIIVGVGQLEFFGHSLRPFWPSGVEWIDHSLIVCLGGAAAISILFLQYRRRMTLVSRIGAIAVIVCVVAIFLFLPPQLALETQARLGPPVTGPDTLHVALDAKAKGKFPIPGMTDRNVQIRIVLPIVVSGIPSGVEVRADGMSGVLQSSNGKAWTLFSSGATGRSPGEGTMIFNTFVLVDRTFFEEVKTQPVTLRASVYLSLFGNARSQTIPIRPARQTVADEFRCFAGEFERLSQFYCGAPFRWPAKMVYAEIREGQADSFYEMVSYSPFPVALGLSPIETHSAFVTMGTAPPSPLGKSDTASGVTIIVKQPLAHFRRDLEVRDLRLTDFTNPGASGKK